MENSSPRKPFTCIRSVNGPEYRDNNKTPFRISYARVVSVDEVTRIARISFASHEILVSKLRLFAAIGITRSGRKTPVSGSRRACVVRTVSETMLSFRAVVKVKEANEINVIKKKNDEVSLSFRPQRRTNMHARTGIHVYTVRARTVRALSTSVFETSFVTYRFRRTIYTYVRFSFATTKEPSREGQRTRPTGHFGLRVPIVRRAFVISVFEMPFDTHTHICKQRLRT